MRLHDPYHRALSALAGFAAEGRFGAGMPLVVTALARELGLSPTPVREALAKLSGEGVIDHWPGRGYFAPRLARADILELYGYHQNLLLWAIDAPVADRAAFMGQEGATAADRLEAVFAAAAGRSGNSVLMRAQRLAAARLRPVRLVEETVAPTAQAQLDALEGLLRVGDMGGFREAVLRYHAGRSAIADSISAAIRRSAESIVQI